MVPFGYFFNLKRLFVENKEKYEEMKSKNGQKRNR